MAPSTTMGIGWLKERSDLRDLWIDVRISPDPASGGDGSIGNLTLRRADGSAPGRRFRDVAASIDGLSLPCPPPPRHFANVKWCSPVGDQLTLGSCAAHAGVGLLGYFENRIHGKSDDDSRAFLSRVAGNLLDRAGDSGACCRKIMGAIAMAAAEENGQDRNFRGLAYHRLDGVEASLPLVDRTRFMISIGWPLMFGFTCYQSLRGAAVAATGEIPYPSATEKVIGGHAAVAVGYDDAKTITNPRRGGKETTGAFLIRNSWGIDWGCVPPDAPEGTTQGYGWLPYAYLDGGLASDWWTLTRAEWNDAGVFGVRREGASRSGAQESPST